MFSETHNEHLSMYLKEALGINKDEEVGKILQKCLNMVDGLEDYLENISPPESALQRKISKDTLNEPWEDHYKNGVMSYLAVLQMISSRHSCTSEMEKVITIIFRFAESITYNLFIFF